MPSRVKSAFDHLMHPDRRLKIAIGAVLILIAIAIAVPLVLMSRPAYFAERLGYEEMYAALEESTHVGIGCSDCHGRSGQAVRDAAAATGEFYRSFFVDTGAPLYVDMQAPTREACLACHETDWFHDTERITRIPHPAHLAVRREVRDCVGCHKWTAHQEDELENHQTMPFSGVCASYGCHVGWNEPGTCVNCHHSLEEEEGAFATAHPDIVLASGDNTCLESCHDIKQCQQCHTTGVSPDFGPVDVESALKEIEALHVRATWVVQHGTKALEDQSKCMRCHVSTGECDSCHERRPDSHGPGDTWIGQHKNANAEEPRCITCHDAVWCEDCHRQFKEMR